MTKTLRILLLVFGLLLIGAIAGFVIWAKMPARPMPEALSALQTNPEVAVSSGEWLVFSPTNTSQPSTGLIIYPGGRVDYRAYAPTAHQIAAQGYFVVIARMPLNLAVFNPNVADRIIAAFPNVQHWAIGGHSLGGAMAANYAANHPGLLKGLVLWAAYPTSSDDLSASGLKVTSIFGSQDGLATLDDIEASRQLLPEDTVWVQIEGGNHAQFGWYGDQAGDNPALISRSEQQNQVVAATISLLEKLE